MSAHLAMYGSTLSGGGSPTNGCEGHPGPSPGFFGPPPANGCGVEQIPGSLGSLNGFARQTSNGVGQLGQSAAMQQQQQPQSQMFAAPMQEFCIKLSMASIEGRPLSVSLARFDDFDNPLIGCSMGFLELSGLTREGVLGKNCRFLNTGLRFPLREKIQHCIRSGTPFMGVLQNMRHLGQGEFETFENLLHLVLIVAGTRRYILGFQADVTGLHLDLADGSLDATRLQTMFDSVLSASCDSWIHFQEGMFHSAPIYLYIRYGAGADEVHIKEEEAYTQGRMMEAPDQCMVLAPRYPVPDQIQPDQSVKWRFLLLGVNQDPGSKPAPECAPHVLSLSQALPVDDTPMDQFRSSCMALNPDANNWMSTMKNQLRALNMEDPASVISARGISKLGVSSATTLRAYFGFYGRVKAVHVPLVFKKRSKEPRSAGKCFIVMDAVQTVSRILADGSEHIVDGVAVTLERFSASTNLKEDEQHDR